MKTGKPINPPAWEHPSPGLHPAFVPLEPAEMEKLALAAIFEAQQFVGGPANSLASDEQRFLADAERRRIHHAANIFVATGAAHEEHVQRWVDALIDLGRFEEAHFYDARADQVAKACARPDDEDCGCEREKVTVTQGSQNVETEIELDRHVPRKFQFDPYRGKVVKLYECRHCGDLNATENPPERQAGRELAQRQIEADVSRAIAKGEVPAVQASDVIFLKTG